MKRLLLALLTVIGCGAAEPKERPRLAPAAAGNPTRVASGQGAASREFADFSAGGSFEDFLQAKSRRPVGLEAAPEVAAARSEQAATKQAVAAKAASQPPSGAESTDPDVLVLPKMEVTAERITKLKAQLAELKDRQALEERIAARAAEPSVLEAILNPPFLRLGSYSSGASAALAQKRLEVLDWVKLLTLSLDLAKTPEERRRIQNEIDGLNEIMRYW
jgi:hypothetical protein